MSPTCVSSLTAAAVTLLSLLCLLPDVATALVMPQVFASHMVLQRAPLRAKLWGMAQPSSKVTCQVDDVGAAVAVQADGAGRWQCELAAHAVSWNRTVSVSGDGMSEVFEDVSFGDVVLCMGQSNMELSLNYTFDGAAVIADSINHPAIRLFGAFWSKSPTPLNNTSNRWGGPSWRLNSPDALYCGDNCAWYYFASTCYHYGLAIDVALQGRVPLGLMQVSFGGTYVEEWTRAEVVPQCGMVPHDNSTTGQIWNGMVAPLINLTVHVTLWYQGETNMDSSADALHYGCAFRTFITDVQRHQRGPANSPFYFVLLAPIHNNTAGPVPWIQGWASQLQALSLPSTAVANTIDLGDNSPLINELHPRNKSLIGQRLALIALSELYGQAGVVTRGPTLRGAQGEVTAERAAGGGVRVALRYPRLPENSLLHVMGTAECTSCCDGVYSALFGVSAVHSSGGAGVDAGGRGASRRALREAIVAGVGAGVDTVGGVPGAAGVYWPAHIDIDVEQRTLTAVLPLPTSVSRVRIDFENAVTSYPECALYNGAILPALPWSMEVDVTSEQAE